METLCAGWAWAFVLLGSGRVDVEASRTGAGVTCGYAPGGGRASVLDKCGHAHVYAVGQDHFLPVNFIYSAELIE